MKRKIIEIDQEKCNGCGLCVSACHEGAIQLKDGKAYLRDDQYCDGLGDCLPHCPTDAIKIIVRQASEFNEELVKSEMKNEVHLFSKESGLAQWPVQLRLISSTSNFLDKSHLLIAADCTAYAYRNFHKDFMPGRITVIGCPKLDPYVYEAKFTEILEYNDIKSITLVRMHVPCCSKLERALENALAKQSKAIPYSIRIISNKGEVIKCI